MAATRHVPSTDVSVVLTPRAGDPVELALDNYSEAGCCLRADASARPIQVGDAIVELNVGVQVVATALQCAVQGRSQRPNDPATYYHIAFAQSLPSQVLKQLRPVRLTTSFVNNEINWRSEHVRHRTNVLLGVSKLYVLTLSALAAYVGIGFQFFDEPGSKATTVFSWVGLALVLIVFSWGIFLLRFAGYIFCSNIMNRKRIVMIRGAYLRGSAHAPPPLRPDEVWVCGGYFWFPYLFAMINFCLLLLLTPPMIYLLLADKWHAWLVAVPLVLLVAIFYPKFCHRYRSDIEVARDFATIPKPKYAGTSTQSHQDLKALGYKKLEILDAKRSAQTSALAGYLALTLLVSALSFVFWDTPGQWPIYFVAAAVVVVMRLATINFRFPQRPQGKSAWAYLRGA